MMGHDSELTLSLKLATHHLYITTYTRRRGRLETPLTAMPKPPFLFNPSPWKAVASQSPIHQACLAVVDGTLALSDCVQQFYTTIREDWEQSGDEENAEGHLWATWDWMARAAAVTPHEKQGPLVEVVAALKELPSPVHDGKEFTVWGSPWPELPVFGASMRETWDQGMCFVIDVIPPIRLYVLMTSCFTVDQETSDWVNLNAYAARLSSAKVDDFSLYAIWTIRGVFEENGPNELTSSNRPSPKELEAAAIWFRYAGELLHTRKKDRETFSERVAIPGKSLEDKDWRGFNEERWGVWLERFRLVVAQDIPDETKQLLTEAIQIMEQS